MTMGRTRRDQADIDLDTRKATIFLPCLTGSLPWVFLQALPLAQSLVHHPILSPVASRLCTQYYCQSDPSDEEQCGGTGGPSSLKKLITFNIFFSEVYNTSYYRRKFIVKYCTAIILAREEFLKRDRLRAPVLPFITSVMSDNLRCPFSDLTQIRQEKNMSPSQGSKFFLSTQFVL